MQKRILKYKILGEGGWNLFFPKDAEFIRIEAERGDVFVWALADPNTEQLERRYFEVFMDDLDIPCDKKIKRVYVGTTVMGRGRKRLLLHFFERLDCEFLKNNTDDE